MQVSSLRFLHSSDWHLELPPSGVAEVPPHLTEHFIDAALSASSRVVDTAISEEVDFVVLSGDIINPKTSGPRGFVHLCQQFERLADSEINVYWAGGRIDPPSLWDVTSLPDNVYLFAANEVDEIEFDKQGELAATLVGRSGSRASHVRVADFRAAASSECPRIAVLHANKITGDFAKQNVDYWALGGEHNSRTVNAKRGLARYCGSPQGRQPEEGGPHGCQLVEFDDEGKVHARQVVTDAIRWMRVAVRMDDAVSVKAVRERLEEESLRLLESSGDTPLLVEWFVEADTTRLADWHSHATVEGVLAGLRSEFGEGDVPLWSADLRVRGASTLPEHWYDEDTILGEYLRQLRESQQDDGESLGLESITKQAVADPVLLEALHACNASEREETLALAAQLGVDLLSE